MKGRALRTFGIAPLALLAGMLPGISTAQVYRCTEGGKTVYSDRPCATSGGPAREINVQSNTVASPSLNERMSYEASLGRLMVGMSADQVERAWAGRRRSTPKSMRAGRVSSGCTNATAAMRTSTSRTVA